ncbi:unnamed protein product [Amoebophrya sp. A120]|nr:unnamed protein product [Amoebophrya sp. A120]|eukprot:GSA120T00013203001.1
MGGLWQRQDHLMQDIEKYNNDVVVAPSNLPEIIFSQSSSRLLNLKPDLVLKRGYLSAFLDATVDQSGFSVPAKSHVPNSSSGPPRGIENKKSIGVMKNSFGAANPTTRRTTSTPTAGTSAAATTPAASWKNGPSLSTKSKSSSSFANETGQGENEPEDEIAKHIPVLQEVSKHLAKVMQAVENYNEVRKSHLKSYQELMQNVESGKHKPKLKWQEKVVENDNVDKSGESDSEEKGVEKIKADVEQQKDGKQEGNTDTDQQAEKKTAEEDTNKDDNKSGAEGASEKPTEEEKAAAATEDAPAAGDEKFANGEPEKDEAGGKVATDTTAPGSESGAAAEADGKNETEQEVLFSVLEISRNRVLQNKPGGFTSSSGPAVSTSSASTTLPGRSSSSFAQAALSRRERQHALPDITAPRARKPFAIPKQDAAAMFLQAASTKNTIPATISSSKTTVVPQLLGRALIDAGLEQNREKTSYMFGGLSWHDIKNSIRHHLNIHFHNADENKESDEAHVQDVWEKDPDGGYEDPNEDNIVTNVDIDENLVDAAKARKAFQQMEAAVKTLKGDISKISETIQKE